MNLRVQASSEISSVETSRVWPAAQTVRSTDKIDTDLQSAVKQQGALEKETVEKVTVESAVESINAAMEFVNRGLRFAVHEDTQRLMVKVVDIITEEVIKEIPPEDLLDTAARIREAIGLLIDERA